MFLIILCCFTSGAKIRTRRVGKKERRGGGEGGRRKREEKRKKTWPEEHNVEGILKEIGGHK